MNPEDTLSEILRWQKLQGIQTLHNILPGILDSEEKKTIYEMTDGKNGVKEVQQRVKVSSGKISHLWNSWFSQGIVEKEGQRYKKIISLKDLGLI